MVYCLPVNPQVPFAIRNWKLRRRPALATFIKGVRLGCFLQLLVNNNLLLLWLKSECCFHCRKQNLTQLNNRSGSFRTKNTSYIKLLNGTPILRVLNQTYLWTPIHCQDSSLVALQCIYRSCSLS